MTIQYFLFDCFLTLTLIFIFGACGFGVTSLLLANKLPSISKRLLVAPFSGVIIIVLGVIFFYTLGFTLALSTTLSLIPSVAISIFYLIPLTFKIIFFKEFWRNISCKVFLPILTITLLTNLLCNSNTLREKSPSLRMENGDNAIGYSLNANWIADHTIQELPSINAKDPIQVIPYQNLRTDQRLGTYVYLAVISKMFLARSAFFSYHIAATVMIAITIIAIASSISINMYFFYIIAALLLLTPLFDLANAGFFGKVLGYPAILYALIITLSNIQLNNKNLLYIVLLTIATSSFYIYVGTFVIFCFTAFLYLIYQWVHRSERDYSLFYFLLALAVISFSCSGGFVVLLGGADGWQRGPLVDCPMNIPFRDLLLLVLNINRIVNTIQIGILFQNLLIVISLAGILMLISLSIILKNRVAFILGLLPVILILIPWMGLHFWRVYQLSFIVNFYLFSSLGILLNEFTKSKNIKVRVLLFLCFFALTIPIVPSFINAVNYSSYSRPRRTLYTQKEFDSIKKIIGDNTVIVDTQGSYDSDPILIELARDHKKLFFTARAWDLTNWGLPYQNYCEFNKAGDASFKILTIQEHVEPPWIPIYVGCHYQLVSKKLL